jgi:hypothetical protein
MFPPALSQLVLLHREAQGSPVSNRLLLSFNAVFAASTSLLASPTQTPDANYTPILSELFTLPSSVT